MLPVYHDVYIEEVTHRRQTTLSRVTFIVSAVMAVLSFVYGFLDRGAFFMCFLFTGLAFLCRWSGQRDFEINYTNGELEIDTIMGKSRRKNLISLQADDIVVLARSKTEPVQPYIGRRMKTYDCISHEPDVPYYCMIYKNSATGEEEKVLFEPGEKLLDELSRRQRGKIYK
ncbi:MAG: hypothetical protein K6B14_02775 [Lachnospiraceae bacterium]|nr:hypothetical protein [Lachnospiraceae bacterium]